LRPGAGDRPAPGRDATTGGYTLLDAAQVPRQKLVHIHASAEELNRVYQADLAINATMNAAARSAWKF
jgi:acetolactate synthase-1/2/3 large subunit